MYIKKEGKVYGREIKSQVQNLNFGVWGAGGNCKTI